MRSLLRSLALFVVVYLGSCTPAEAVGSILLSACHPHFDILYA